MKTSLFFIFILFFSTSIFAQEICDNGIDDDLDGLIDLNDTLDCNCDLISSGNGIPSILPNSSFELNTCCPNGWSQLNCADNWEQATNATTDYLHTCNFYPFFAPPPPDGDAIVGSFILQSWREYVGGCLLQPIIAGVQHTFSLWIACEGTDGSHSMVCPFLGGPIDITLFGLPTCPTFPIPTSTCPVPNGWTELGSITYDPLNAWQQISINFVAPFDVDAVMLGSPCNLPASYPTNSSGLCFPYFMFDDFTLNQSIFFQANIDIDGHFCTDDLVLTAHPDTLGSYQWFQEGIALIGETDTIIDISAGAYGPGDFTFQLSIGIDSCALATINLPPPVYPDVDFSGNNLVDCSPLTVDFTNLTDPALTDSCIWDFGNGNMGYTCDTTFIYTVPGTYDVSLTVISPDGCISDSTAVGYVIVNDFAEVTFTSDTLAGCADLLVNFTNTTDPNIIGTCAWTFGDGGTSSDCDPLYIYSISGVYDVSLSITSPDGCVSDTTYSQLITVYEVPNTVLSVDDPDGCYPHAVNFSNDTDPLLTGSCEWIFGDGGTSTDCDPAYTYNAPGVYDVTLIVTSPNGCVDSTQIISMIEAYDFPVVLFSVDDSAGCYDHSVNFTNLTDPALIGNCDWTFGDGNGSTDCDPAYTYTDPGVYDVHLSVTSPDGCTSDTTITSMIEIYDHPTAGFIYGPDPTDLYNTEISFLDQSSSDVVQWLYDFAASGTSDSQDPSFVFPNDLPGEYVVTQTVTNANGCQDVFQATVIINGLFNLYVPNAFSPDGDGINEVFHPSGEGIDPTDYEFSIFDRWGERLFHTEDPTTGWDGTFSGEVVKTDIYVWKLIIRNIYNGEKKDMNGSVTLLR